MSKNMAFDWFGASAPKGRQLSLKSLVIWEAIKEAKRQGLNVFDFEGIYDSRFHQTQKNWQGFSFFKKGFGGEEIEFSQPLIKLLPGGA
jgi:lipid II:glycine glycyltransferase (peptidoglycan interpeptide bridge formation enzyme)